MSLVEISVADYTLPDLPDDYGALEPHVSGEIMELHHSKHHATYVKGANTALEQLAKARAADQLGTVNLLQKNLAFNLGGARVTRNVKAVYVEAWWNVANWADVARWFERARSVTMP
jgi:superoxide dismutase